MKDLTIEVGKKYRTRGGRIAEVLGVSKNPDVLYPYVGFIVGGGLEPYSWRVNGRENSYREKQVDLVAEYADLVESWVVIGTRKDGTRFIAEIAADEQEAGRRAERCRSTYHLDYVVGRVREVLS
jgi:hypothetical protein